MGGGGLVTWSWPLASVHPAGQPPTRDCEASCWWRTAPHRRGWRGAEASIGSGSEKPASPPPPSFLQKMMWWTFKFLFYLQLIDRSLVNGFCQRSAFSDIIRSDLKRSTLYSVLWIRIKLKGWIRMHINVKSWMQIRTRIKAISWIRIRVLINLQPKCMEYEPIWALFQGFEP